MQLRTFPVIKYGLALLCAVFLFACSSTDGTDLTGKSLESIPAEIGNATGLQQLIVRDNQLTKFPELASAATLKKLDLSWNDISELPASIGHMKDLEELNLACNNLTNLPAAIAQLPKLQKVVLFGNPIEPKEEMRIKAMLKGKDLSFYSILNDADKVYMSKAVFYHQKDSLVEASYFYDLAIEENPRFAEAYLNRGIVNQNTQRFEQALSDYNMCIQLNPQLTSAFVNRGIIKLAVLKDPKGACQDWSACANTPMGQQYLAKYCQ